MTFSYLGSGAHDPVTFSVIQVKAVFIAHGRYSVSTIWSAGGNAPGVSLDPEILLQVDPSGKDKLVDLKQQNMGNKRKSYS